MKIAFVSTRGIPNNYGGFEQFAERISEGLVARGHEVIVYSPHFHPYKEEEYHGVRIKHIFSPEKWMGSATGSFFYDWRSLKDALFVEKPDIIYECGYTSIIPAYLKFGVRKLKSPIIVTNMDGLEYKRSKFNALVRRFIFWEEKQAVRCSHHLVADNMAIKDYYLEKYGKPSTYMAYGADIVKDFDLGVLKPYSLCQNQYYLIIARLEPENNIKMTIDGYIASKEYGKKPLVIVGKTNTKHGRWLVKTYGDHDCIKFVGGIYNADALNSLRHYCYAYFHGHSVGGTNPSLLEAMASSCFIMSHDNIFNKTVLGENAFYYGSSEAVMTILNNIKPIVKECKKIYINNNLDTIATKYNWDSLVLQHEQYFKQVLGINDGESLGLDTDTSS